MMGGVGSGWMWLWSALVVLGALTIGYAVVQLARGGRAGGPAGPDTAAVRRILDQRLARGEIDEEEYRRRRDALR